MLDLDKKRKMYVLKNDNILVSLRTPFRAILFAAAFLLAYPNAGTAQSTDEYIKDVDENNVLAVFRFETTFLMPRRYFREDKIDRSASSPFYLSFQFNQLQFSSNCVVKSKGDCEKYDVMFDYFQNRIPFLVDYYCNLDSLPYSLYAYRWESSKLEELPLPVFFENALDNSECKRISDKTGAANLLYHCPIIRTKGRCLNCACQVEYSLESGYYFRMHVPFHSLWKIKYYVSVLDAAFSSWPQGTL